MRLSAAGAAAAGLVLLVGSCGGGDADDRVDMPAPAERLSSAVTALAEAGTGRFASETTSSQGSTYSTIEGAYRLTPPAARATVTRHVVDGVRLATEVVAVGPDAWSRDRPADPDEPAGCWVHHDVTALFANGLLVRNGDTYSPAPVAVAARGWGAISIDADQVTGTSELSTVLSVVDLALPSALAITSAADHRVPATFTVDDGVLTGWRVSARDALGQGRRHAGQETGAANRLAAAVGMGGRITTRFSDQGDEVDIAAPPARQVVEYVADRDALERAVRACTTGGSATERGATGGSA